MVMMERQAESALSSQSGKSHWSVSADDGDYGGAAVDSDACHSV